MDERLLSERFHAALDIEPRPGAANQLADRVEQLGAQPRVFEWPALAMPRPANRLVAAALILTLALAGMGAFLALEQYIRNTLPARNSGASGPCVQGLHMITDKIGWNGPWSRTSDGGTTWKDVRIPSVMNESKGPTTGCTLDALHAWVTEPSGYSVLDEYQLHILATSDGGQTWVDGSPLPASGADMGVVLGFLDALHGWLLTDTLLDGSPPRTRTVYSTSDGGLHWTRLASAAWSDKGALGQSARGCPENGLTFTSLTKGWLTWDCGSGGPDQVSPAGSVIATTDDGGVTWRSVALPSLGATADAVCGATPPVIAGERGLLGVTCTSVAASFRPFGRLYRTTDAGASWIAGPQMPMWEQLRNVDLVDPTTAFEFASTRTSSDLYRSDGNSWVLVRANVFPGQFLYPETEKAFQFLDAKRGLAITSPALGGQSVLWTTTDGGLTWLPIGFRLIAGDVACPVGIDPGAGSAPLPIYMPSRTTGWAVGGRHTTDGGLRWSSPAPSAPDRSSGHADFFLDALHAWEAEPAGSATACADHIVVYSTADGGQTWQQGAPIPVAERSAADLIWGGLPSYASRSTILEGGGPFMSFVDSMRGWLQVVTAETSNGVIHLGPLYKTVDGGLVWTVVSQAPALNYQGGGGCSSVIGISFLSVTTGWMANQCPATSGAIFLVTHDGGATWKAQDLGLPCDCPGTLPAFFDSEHGLVWADDGVLTTANGGASWTYQALSISASLMWPGLDFISPQEGWAVTGDSESRLTLNHTTDGGKTWSVVTAGLASPPSGGNGAYLVFVDSQYGYWATGSALYRTMDGGHTWSKMPIAGDSSSR